MKDKMMRYYRIRDIVQYVYVNYVLQQIEVFGDKVEGEALAEESMLLILDILNNKPHLTDQEISTLAVNEAYIDRPWHRG